MKAINKWTLAVALLAGLSSCEMKDEILGKDPLTGDTGILSLYVETGKTTKGTTDQVDQFPVTITGTDVEYTKKFDSYAELKQAGNVTLPVGTYTIEACSPGEFKSEMSEPFYGGKVENVKIMKGQTVETPVVCTMQNVKISISFTEEFLATYQDWTINVTDKSGHIETYTKAEDGDTPAPVYWKMDENVETIYINGTAKTIGNEDVTISGTAKKSNLPEYEEGDDIYFVGGDELKIEFSPVKVEGSTPGILEDGIQITITMFNSEKNENVEIPVDPGTEGGDTEEPGTGEDGGDEEDGGETNAITISDNGTGYLTTGVTVIDEIPTDVKISMKIPNGINNVFVKIVTESSPFKETLLQTPYKGLIENENGMDLTDPESQSLSELFPLPKKGEENTSYDFTMSEDLFGMLGLFEGKHDFELKIIDLEGNSKSATLTININTNI